MYKCIFFFQDENSRLEPGEFKQCLVSLGYNLKEGDKVWQCLLLCTYQCKAGGGGVVEAGHRVGI